MGGDSPETYSKFLGAHTDLRELDVRPEFAHDRAYPKSVAGEWQHVFNPLGYRGDIYDPDADFTLAVIGCSLTIGVGVHWEQTWGVRLKEKIHQHLNNGKTTCLNFSQSGGSNDYIARTAVRQFSAKKPDLAVIHFTRMMRRELLQGESILTFSSWTVKEDPLLESLLDCYTNEEAAANLIKNLLLVSNFCSSRDIPLLFAVSELRLIADTIVPSTPALVDLWNAVDSSKLLRCTLNFEDVGRDNSHPGPHSHEKFAEKVFQAALPILVSKNRGL